MTEVVAALIWDCCRFLICQRPAHKARGLLWEFVGGKVESGETKEEALVRECTEELGIEVDVGPVFMEVIHEYPDLTVRLSLFHAFIVKGKPQLLEHNAVAWITPEQIDEYSFCPADIEILEKLKSIHDVIEACLISMADPTYRTFQCGLMPTADPESVLGVRMPQLRKLVNLLGRYTNTADFLSNLPHRYYEENNLHALLICAMPDYHQAVAALQRFLPFLDNWATCDMMTPKSFCGHQPQLEDQVLCWLQSNHCYTQRFAIGILMKFYLDEAFKFDYLTMVASVRSSDYYVKMMIAWFFATALAKQYDHAILILEQRLLDPWTHNKTIQKALESNRICDDKKQFIKTLRRHLKEGTQHA